MGETPSYLERSQAGKMVYLGRGAAVQKSAF
jgi:hypothetical protein